MPGYYLIRIKEFSGKTYSPQEAYGSSPEDAAKSLYGVVMMEHQYKFVGDFDTTSFVESDRALLFGDDGWRYVLSRDEYSRMYRRLVDGRYMDYKISSCPDIQAAAYQLYGTTDGVHVSLVPRGGADKDFDWCAVSVDRVKTAKVVVQISKDGNRYLAFDANENFVSWLNWSHVQDFADKGIPMVFEMDFEPKRRGTLEPVELSLL